MHVSVSVSAKVFIKESVMFIYYYFHFKCSLLHNKNKFKQSHRIERRDWVIASAWNLVYYLQSMLVQICHYCQGKLIVFCGFIAEFSLTITCSPEVSICTPTDVGRACTAYTNEILSQIKDFFRLSFVKISL